MPSHGKKTRVFVDKYDLSRFFKSADTTGDVPTIDTTTFNASAKTFIPDYIEGGLSLSGVWSADAYDAVDNPTGLNNQADDVLQPALGSNTNQNWTVARDGVDVAGSPAELLTGKETKYSITAPTNNLVSVACEVKADGANRRGIILAEAATRTVTGNGSNNDNAVATTNGGVAHLHCYGMTGTTPNMVVAIEDSADGTTGWAPIATFAALTAIGSERVLINGTIRRYVRAKWTMTGGTQSETFIVALARL